MSIDENLLIARRLCIMAEKYPQGELKDLLRIAAAQLQQKYVSEKNQESKERFLPSEEYKQCRLYNNLLNTCDNEYTCYSQCSKRKVAPILDSITDSITYLQMKAYRDYEKHYNKKEQIK